MSVFKTVLKVIAAVLLLTPIAIVAINYKKIIAWSKAKANLLAGDVINETVTETTNSIDSQLGNG